MKSLFDDNVYEEIKVRFNQLHKNSKPLWGKMTVGQMAYHCQMPLNIILGKEDYNLKPNWIVNLLFKKAMYNDYIWVRSLPTVSAFKVIENKDFKVEIVKLKNLLDELHTNRKQNEWPKHPFFGNFTKQQWGQIQYKHLDHHLRQFGK